MIDSTPVDPQRVRGVGRFVVPWAAVADLLRRVGGPDLANFEEC